MERFVVGLFVSFGIGDLVYRLRSEEIMICNPGVAFGIVVPEAVLWTSFAILFFGILWQAYRSVESAERLAWIALLIAGTVNGLDRFLEGCIRDYLNLSPFPSFNVADMMLLLGVLYLLGQMSGIFSTRKPYVS